MTLPFADQNIMKHQWLTMKPFVIFINIYCRTPNRLNSNFFLVVHADGNDQREIWSFGCNVHVKSEQRHFVKLERSNITDSTTKVLCCVFFVFFLFFFQYFSFSFHYQMTVQLQRRQSLSLSCCYLLDALQITESHAGWKHRDKTDSWIQAGVKRQ